MWTSLMFLCFKKVQQACDNCQDSSDTDFTITKKNWEGLVSVFDCQMQLKLFQLVAIKLFLVQHTVFIKVKIMSLQLDAITFNKHY
jgi:hypothetical protein